MKHIWKTFRRAALFVLCAVLSTACMTCLASASAENAADKGMQSTLVSTAESLTRAIAGLSQEEIDSYKESGDEFTIKAMEAWETNRAELGKLKKMGKTSVEKISTGYVVTLSAKFSNRNAEFIFTTDENGVPNDFSIDIQYPMSTLLQRAGMNTAMGMGIVFLMLIFLTLVISLFQFIGKSENEPAPELTGTTRMPAPAAVHADSAAPEQDNQELIAVIAAAIAAYEGTTTDSFVVRSIRKATRKKSRW